MRTLLLSVLFLSFFWSNCYAQKLIALQHQGDASFFITLQAAYDAAVNGDTIYIPGGYFPGLTLNKSLALIGVGHHPDSTSATGRTVLAGLYINENADNGFVTGISVTSSLYTNGDVTNFTVSRCYLGGGIVFSFGVKTNWNIQENYVGYTGISGCSNYSIYRDGTSPTNCLIANNVVSNGIILNNLISTTMFSSPAVFRQTNPKSKIIFFILVHTLERPIQSGTTT